MNRPSLIEPAPVAASDSGINLGAKPVVHVSIRSSMLISLVAMLSLISFALGWTVHHSVSDPNSHRAHSFAGPTTPGVETQKSPWGDMEFVRINIKPPLEHLSELMQEPTPRRWYFAMTREELDKVFKEAELSAEQIAVLWANQIKEMDLVGGETENVFIFSPSDEFVIGMTPKTRAKLYVYLSIDDHNPEQVNAGRYLGSSVEEWMAPAALPDEIVELVKSLSYRNEQYWMFADMSIVLPKLTTTEERNRFVETVDLRQSWIVRMRVTDTTDVDAMAEYWGRGGRVNTIKPFLRSLTSIPGGEYAGMKALLPPFAKSRLYVCPPPTSDPVERMRDCHWSAMNFFNDQPDDSFATNAQHVLDVLQQDYYLVFANFKMGDIIAFYTDGPDDKQQFFHSAVYLSDDLVFTKNGRRPADPWLVMKFDEVKNYYPRPGKIRQLYWRHKEIGD